MPRLQQRQASAALRKEFRRVASSGVFYKFVGIDRKDLTGELEAAQKSMPATLREKSYART
jgi:hypothetical protein